MCTSGVFLGTLLCRLFTHSLVHFGRCVTSYAAHESARESAVTGRMTCDTANECAFDAAFGGRDAWGERNREG
jgi:hypothetical protein